MKCYPQQCSRKHSGRRNTEQKWVWEMKNLFWGPAGSSEPGMGEKSGGHWDALAGRPITPRKLPQVSAFFQSYNIQVHRARCCARMMPQRIQGYNPCWNIFLRHEGALSLSSGIHIYAHTQTSVTIASSVQSKTIKNAICLVVPRKPHLGAEQC